MKFTRTGRVLACLLASTALYPGPGMAEIGSVSAVNLQMDGTPPEAVRRSLNLGQTVVTDERIETSADGSGQLLFVDQTSLSVAPNTDIVLDSYVYDPAQEAGDMTLSLVKGSLRFIGGRITKKRSALVRTPSATIGIRGGMVHIEVDENGKTSVIHLAGEFTSVTTHGDADGDGLDDGPGDDGDDGGGESTVLSRPGAAADALGGEVQFTGLASDQQISAAFGSLSVAGDGGFRGVLGDAEVEARTSGLAPLNSQALGSSTSPPVSTTGERTPEVQEDPEDIALQQQFDEALVEEPLIVEPPVEEPPIVEPPIVVVPPIEQPPVEQPPVDEPPIQQPPPPVEPTELPLVAPDAGSLVLGQDADTPGDAFVQFTEVTIGSIEATDGDTFISVPVPLSSDELLLENPEGATPAAVSRNEFSGLFTFDTSNSDSSFGGLEGVGFSDFGNNFHFVPFAAPDAPDGLVTGAAIFGNATPGQGQFFADDPNTAGANTLDVYTHEFSLDVGDGFISSGAVAVTPNEFLIVGNSGEARFSPGTSVGDANLTGKALASVLDISNAGANQLREEKFSLFVAPLSSRDGELRISGSGFGSTNSQNGDFYSFFNADYGTLEDGQGNTLFGEEGNYFALSSVQFDDAGGAVIPDSFGAESLLFPGVPGGVVDLAAPFTAVPFTRDADSSEIIDDPLPLASTGATVGFDAGFAAGLAICSTGNCGNTEDADEGFYSLISDGANVAITFDSGGTGDVNGLGGDFGLVSRGDAGIARNSDDPSRFAFRWSDQNAADVTTAYVDDSRFAVQSESNGQIIAGSLQNAAFVLASQDAVELRGRDLLFAAGQDTQPEFLRWGWWAAEYEVTDSATGEVRTDLVPLGQFITGVRPDEADIPSDIVATYEGFAVGTRADLNTGATGAVGGSFGLEYDFRTDSGRFDLNMNGLNGAPEAAYSTTVAGGQLRSEFVGFSRDANTSLAVEGGFFQGSASPVEAAAGTFNASNETLGTQTIGIFGSTAVTTEASVPLQN